MADRKKSCYKAALFFVFVIYNWFLCQNKIDISVSWKFGNIESLTIISN